MANCNYGQICSLWRLETDRHAFAFMHPRLDVNKSHCLSSAADLFLELEEMGQNGQLFQCLVAIIAIFGNGIMNYGLN